MKLSTLSNVVFESWIMSRTRHHKGQKNRKAGYELWSKRPLSGENHTPKNKRISRKIERKRKPIKGKGGMFE